MSNKRCDCIQPNYNAFTDRCMICGGYYCSDVVTKNNQPPMTQSNEPTIEQMNEAIGIFMGGFWKEFKSGNFKQKRFYYKDEPFAWVKSPENLNYHKDWNELMPVVIRIKNDESLRLRVPCNGISDSIWPYINATKYMNQRLLRADITGTHEGVYQFIQWYQQQKQSNG